MSVTGSEWMAAALASHQCQVTVIDMSAWTGWQPILPADPRRWWVQFQQASNVIGFNPPMPGPTAPTIAFATSPQGPWEYKFTDAPAVVGQTWWGFGAAGAILVAIEDLYVGG